MPTLTDSERAAKLVSLGLAADGDTLAPTAPAKPSAPAGIDPHAMPVSDIAFDPAVIAEFDLDSGHGFKEASDRLFKQYRSPHKDKDRHGLLHRRITEFVGQQRLARKAGGHVKEAVKVDRETRDLAKLLASKGLTVADLVALLNTES